MLPANTTFPYSRLSLTNRMRADLGDIEELANSIEELGLICPLCVDEEGNVLAGGRRYAAITLIRNRIKPEADFIPFADVPVYIRYDLTEHQRGLVELEENLRRKDMTWQEKCLGIAQVHEAHESLANRDGEKWTRLMTGQLLGLGDGSHSSVVNAVILSRYLRDGDEEIVKAENPNQAQQILFKRKQRELEARGAALKKAALAVREAKRESVTVKGPTNGHVTVIEPAVADALPDLSDATLDAYEKACSIIGHGDSHEYMNGYFDQKFDGIYTDIPYGINADNLELKHINETKAEHDRKENIALFDDFLRLAYQATKDEAFCVFWYDVEHHTTLLELARKHGWIPQRWNLRAFKPIAKNEAAGYNTTKDYEDVFVCRKQNTTLTTRRSTSRIPWIWNEGEKERYSHPFCKPHSANQWLLETFFPPGATLLDPYCGEGSLVLSGLRLGYEMTGIDKVEAHVNRARTHVESLLK